MASTEPSGASETKNTPWSKAYLCAAPASTARRVLPLPPGPTSVSNRQVDVEDGVVTLAGEAESAEALEKAVLMAGNVEGVAEVRSDNVVAPAATDKVEYYEIVSGDTLSAIAQKYYRKASAYPKIFEANREVIKDPDLIYPGQKIRIPPKTW